MLLQLHISERTGRGIPIDVARHMKKNTPFIGNIAYSQREYSYDNDLMELVRHTIEYIKGKNVEECSLVL